MAITKQAALARSKQTFDFDSPEEQEIDKILAGQYRGIPMGIDVLAHMTNEEARPILQRYFNLGWKFMKMTSDGKTIWIFE